MRVRKRDAVRRRRGGCGTLSLVLVNGVVAKIKHAHKYDSTALTNHNRARHGAICFVQSPLSCRCFSTCSRTCASSPAARPGVNRLNPRHRTNSLLEIGWVERLDLRRDTHPCVFSSRSVPLSRGRQHGPLNDVLVPLVQRCHPARPPVV